MSHEQSNKAVSLIENTQEKLHIIIKEKMK